MTSAIPERGNLSAEADPSPGKSRRRNSRSVDLAQALIDEDASIDLRSRDIALLVMIRERLQLREDQSVALSESEIRSLSAKLSDFEGRDAGGAEKRTTESLNRLLRAECIARSDISRIQSSDDSELQLTSLGESIADWHLEHGQFNGEPLTTILRVFASQLVEIADEAESVETPEQWDAAVVLPMQHVLKDMLVNIQRHQKALDRQHDELRKFIPMLLTESSEASITLCESRLAHVAKTIHDLHEATLASTTNATALLLRIEAQAEAKDVQPAISVCVEISRRIQAIAFWTNQRLADWGEHHRVVHDFLRNVVRIDRARKLTDSLKRAVSKAPDWTLQVASTSRLMHLQIDGLGTSAKKAPRRLRRDYQRAIEETPVDDVRERLEALLEAALMNGEATLSSLIRDLVADGDDLPLVAFHTPWLIARMANVGRVDTVLREWREVGRGAQIQELRIIRK